MPPDLGPEFFMTELTKGRHRPFGRQADRFRDLLLRYPKVSETQIGEMVSIYRRLAVLEMALLSADESVAKPLHAFLRDHAGRVHARWRDHVIFLLSFFGSFALIVVLIVAVMR